MKTLLTTLCLTSAVLLGNVAHGYDGPIFDAMAQIDKKSGFKKSISRVRNSGVAKIALFARSGKLGEYETELIKLREDNKDLIILGAPKYFFHKSDIGQDFITRTLKNISKYNYAFVGEILYTHADKKHGRQHNSGEVYINPHGKGNLKFLEKVSKKNVPIMTHWEFYNWKRDWVKFSKLYAEHPSTQFIIPHMGFGSVDQVDEILTKHPNVYMTISKKEARRTMLSDAQRSSSLDEKGFLKKRSEGKLLLRDSWRKLLIKHQDKLMFATDAHKKFRWKKYPKIIAKWRYIFKQLPLGVAEKIAYTNAEKIYGVKVK